MFLKAVDTRGEIKDVAYIVGQLIDCIREVNADNVIQVVTDNAAICKAVGRLVEQDNVDTVHPTLFGPAP
jgi:hypothetical protein